MYARFLLGFRSDIFGTQSLYDKTVFRDSQECKLTVPRTIELLRESSVPKAPLWERGKISFKNTIECHRHSRFLTQPHGHEAGAAVDSEFAEDLGDVFVGHVAGFADLLGDRFLAVLGEEEVGDPTLDG